MTDAKKASPDRSQYVEIDPNDDFWRPGLRLRSGSPTMLQDEFERFERERLAKIGDDHA